MYSIFILQLRERIQINVQGFRLVPWYHVVFNRSCFRVSGLPNENCLFEIPNYLGWCRNVYTTFFMWNSSRNICWEPRQTNREVQF